jgi:hypothetical protein
MANVKSSFACRPSFSLEPEEAEEPKTLAEMIGEPYDTETPINLKLMNPSATGSIIINSVVDGEYPFDMQKNPPASLRDVINVALAEEEAVIMLFDTLELEYDEVITLAELLCLAAGYRACMPIDDVNIGLIADDLPNTVKLDTIQLMLAAQTDTDMSCPVLTVNNDNFLIPQPEQTDK